jgi:Mrp family chromosome partitioning ATPase
MTTAPVHVTIDDWRRALSAAVQNATAERSVAAPFLDPAAVEPGIIDRCRMALTELTAETGNQPSVFGVVSPNRGDGRSIVAAGLALALARKTGERVLLLELDVAHPGLGDIFGVGSAPGLSDYVREGAPLQVLRDPGGDLCLLPAGTPSGLTPALVDALTDGALYQACRERFRWIVADLPPLLECLRPERWSMAAEAIVMVGRYRRTPLARMQTAAAMLPAGRLAGFLMAADTGISPWFRRWL